MWKTRKTWKAGKRKKEKKGGCSSSYYKYLFPKIKEYNITSALWKIDFSILQKYSNILTFFGISQKDLRP